MKPEHIGLFILKERIRAAIESMKYSKNPDLRQYIEDSLRKGRERHQKWLKSLKKKRKD